jgi:hypothetical protein
MRCNQKHPRIVQPHQEDAMFVEGKASMEGLQVFGKRLFPLWGNGSQKERMSA